MTRLVVEEHQPARADGARERDRVGNARVTPADPLLVLLLEILRIVNERVDARRERRARDPVGRSSGDRPGERRLVIRDVREARAPRLDPVPDRGTGMDNEVRRDRDAVDRPGPARDIVEGHGGRDVPELDREERRREGARDAFPETQLLGRRSPDVELYALIPERREEAQSFEVVEVEVSEAEMDLPHAAVQELETQPSDPGAGVEHENRAVVQRDLDAGRVSAVGDGLRPRCWHRAAAAPDRHAHAAPYSRQKIATIPTNSSACAKSGNAVTATSRSTPSMLLMRRSSCAARRWSKAMRVGQRSGESGSESGVSGSKRADHASSVFSPSSANGRPTTDSAASL